MPSVGLRERLQELQKWTLAPVGAVLAVALLTGGIVWMLATGGDPSPEEVAREYFASPAGGGASRAQASRIRVSNCAALNRVAHGEVVYECNVVYANTGYTGCFAWNSKGIVAGSRELADIPGCEPLFWDKTTGTLVAR